MTIGWLATGGRMRSFLRSPLYLQSLPAIGLLAYWLVGEAGLVSAAIAGPLLFMLAGQYQRINHDPVTGLPSASGFENLLSDILADAELRGRSTAVLSLAVEDMKGLKTRHGRAGAEGLLKQIAQRMEAALRDTDQIVHLSDGKFLIGLTSMRSCDLEAMIQLSSRLQDAISEPILIHGTNEYLSISVGFCLLSRAPSRSPSALIDAADRALSEARQNGPGSIRAFSRDMLDHSKRRSPLQTELLEALEKNQIVAWFQPQISTDTGRVTGIETLARWDHPDRGIVEPSEFLGAIEEADLSEQLTEIMLSLALKNLRNFDKAGVDIPTVSVNFSSSELRNPKLVDRVRWELDRFDLLPGRLCIEILETVIAKTDDDIITRNIKALSDLGCKIDLDDFGTGHASISSIRRFAIQRIKIDRSFVSNVDGDQAQREMISAILTMAEQLHLDTLAEGVETIAEHAMLSQLGCQHVQGYGIARPMPADKLPVWVERHSAKLGATPSIEGRTG